MTTGRRKPPHAVDDPRIAYGERLTPRQRLFVEAVAQGKNQTEAATLAGYTGDFISATASSLMNLPKIQQALSLARTAYEATREFTIEWWRKELSAAHAAAVLAGDIPSRLRALELAGRHLGALESRTDQANAERALRLTELLTIAMAEQMRAPLAATDYVGQTVEAQVRALMAPPVGEDATLGNSG